MAMLGFAGIVSTELSTKTPLLEQLEDNLIPIALISISITFATIIPKLISGISLKDLTAAATGPNQAGPGLGQAMMLFDESYELWIGRIAMFGVVGLGVAEVLKGDAFFPL